MSQAKLTLEEAVELLLQNTPTPRFFVSVPLLDALGRVAAGDYVSRFDQPPFDRSPLDGYAARCEDIADATPENPAILTVVQKIYAGAGVGKPIGPGEAAFILTGAPLPPGANCVVAQEDADKDAERVKIRLPLKKHQNCVFRGEDIKAGHLMAERGTKLNSAHIGILAGQGICELEVYPRNNIALMSVGNELAPPSNRSSDVPAGETPLPFGMIYESNSWTLAARVLELGGESHVAKCAMDDPCQIATALEKLLGENDFVITTGGVSVGERDYMPQALKKLNANTLFHGLKYKPGGITLGVLKDGKLILCLPGNPFAAFMSFELLARPALGKLAGLKDFRACRIRAVLRGTFPKHSHQRRFIRGCMVGGEVFVEKEGHAAGSLSSLTRCNCLIDIPAASPPLPDGSAVEVLTL